MDAGLISSQDLALGALWRLPTAIQMRKGQMQGPNFPVLCILHVEKSALVWSMFEKKKLNILNLL